MTTTTADAMPGLGHNRPSLPKQISDTQDIAVEVTEFLEDQFRGVAPAVAALLDRAREVPKEITDDATLGTAAKLIKDLRDEAAKIEALRVKEKEPYLRGGQAVDNFFSVQFEKCRRSTPKARPGAADVLQGRVDDYMQRKLAEEQARRRREAEEQARVAREAQEKADREAREAEEKRQAAERARKPESVVAKTAVADAAETSASVAAAVAANAYEKAEAAHIDTLAKPADMVRTRVEEGPTVTMAKEPYAIIEDETLLDKNALWPFIPLEAKERALRAWAKNHGHNVQMAGAKIGHRPKTAVR